MKRTVKVITASLLALTGMNAVVGTQQPLDGTWTAFIGARSAIVNPDGTFVITNVSAADFIGAGGPQTGPDFISDDELRMIATRTVNGRTEYAFSERFRIRRNNIYEFQSITITTTPPPSVAALLITASREVLTATQQTSQLTTTARLNSGLFMDVTRATEWTTYRCSDPQLAEVDPSTGIVTALRSGTVFITATNEGAATVKRLTIAIGDPLTTVVGFAELASGAPIAGATVSVLGQTLQATTETDGRFRLVDVPTQNGAIEVQVRGVVGGQLYTGVRRDITPEPGALTDAGRIVLGAGDSRFAAAESRGAGSAAAGEFVLYDAATLIETARLALPTDVGDVEVSPSAAFAYVAAPVARKVTRIDLTGNDPRLDGEITLPFSPSDVDILPTGLGVANGDTAVGTFDILANTVIDTEVLPTNVRAVVAHGNGQWLFVLTQDDRVRRLDVSGAGQVSNPNISVATGGSGGLNLSLSLDGATLLVAHDTVNNVGLIAVGPNGSLTAGSPIAVGATQQSIAWHPQGTRAFAYSPRTGTVRVLTRDGSGNLVFSSSTPGLRTDGIRYGGTDQIAFSSDGLRALVHEPNRLVILNAQSGLVSGFFGSFKNPGAGGVAGVGR